MSEELIIKHAAPTLAGIKTGNIFNCKYDDKATLMADLRELNRKLRAKGLCIIPLRVGGNTALLYLYRPAMLQADLSGQEAGEILRRMGYSGNEPARCIVELSRRICCAGKGTFPHEVGLFISYPPEDVVGFMENKAASSKCVCAWKVYGDEEKARATLCRYQKAVRAFEKCWRRGMSLQELAVAIK